MPLGDLFMLTTPWRIQLLGRFRAQQGDDNVERFRRGKEASLLAYLACHLSQSHVREQLVDRFWPDADLDAGRGSLRVALTSLRRRLEPPGVPSGAVLLTNRLTVQLNSKVVMTDVAQFEAALAKAARTEQDKISHFQEAVGLYQGELLPGYLDDWIGPERERMALSFVVALDILAQALGAAGNLPQALDYALRAIAADPLHEEGHLTLIRLYAQAGRIHEARNQYRRLCHLLQTEFQAEPSAKAQQLAKDLRVKPETFLEILVPISPGPPLGESSAANALAKEVRPHPGATSLPAQTTRFFGREQEIGDILAALRHERLVTLTGPGGSGKTRLALEVGFRLAGEQEGFSHPVAGIWFIALAELTQAGLIMEIIRGAVCSSLKGNEAPLEKITQALADQPTLLILDNFEQLVEEGASVVQTLLERLPYLCCLVTSRRELDLPGERTVGVLPLPVPTTANTLEQLLSWPSVRLFVDRAQARAPEFHVTTANAEAIGDLVRRLEGMPLALELAAAWIRVHPPSRILAQLQDRFGFLTKNRRGVPQRHQTLWNAVGWSYFLLPAKVQPFLVSLSVFRGGWTLEAAAEVSQEPEASSHLSMLQEHSWVTAIEKSGERRFLMLDTLREFAAAQAPREVKAARSRHAAYVLRLAEAADPTQAADLDRLVGEQENWRAALSWYETREYEMGENKTTEERSAEALRLVGALGNLWLLRGYVREGRQWVTQALARAGETGDPVWQARALLVQGNLARYQNDFDATQSSYEQSLALYNTAADAIGSAKACNALGNLAWNRGNLEKAREWYELALATGGEYLDGLNQAAMLENLGNYWSQRKQYAEADRHYEKSRSLFHAAGDLRGLGRVAHNQGSAANAAGHLIRALSLLQEGLTIQWEREYKIGVAYALEEIANVLRQQSYEERTARLWGAAEALREQLEAPYPAEDREAYLAAVANVQARLGKVRAAEAWQAGRHLSLEEAVQEAQHPAE